MGQNHDGTQRVLIDGTFCVKTAKLTENERIRINECVEIFLDVTDSKIMGQ